MPIDETYKFKVGQETIPQYNDRITSYNASKTPAPTPINRTILEGQQYNPGTSAPMSAAESYLDTFRAPESREQIIERKRQASQGLIDSINKQFDDRVTERRQVGAERVQRDNTLSILTGNMGGSEAIQSRNKVDTANAKEIDAVNNERALALSQVYSDISATADQEAREQLMDATRSAEQILARREASQAKAVENLKLMASSGAVDFDVFKNTPENRKVYDFALQSVGGSEDALRAMFMLNRPKDQILGTPQRIGNKYVQAYQNAQTGKVAYEQIDLPFDLPQEYSTFQKMGDNLVAIPDGWDGDVSKLKTIIGQKSTEDTLREQSLRMDIALKGKELNSPDKEAVKEEKAASQARANAQSAYEAVSSLLTSAGKSKAVGVKGLSNYLPGTAAQSFKADLERTKALLTLPALQQMKGLGAMSDREFATLSSSAAALNTSMSQADFDKELNRIKAALQSTISTGSQNVVTAPDGQEVIIID